MHIGIYPNPTADLLIIQAAGITSGDLIITLYDLNGRQLAQTQIAQGQTITYFDTKTLYAGNYIVHITNGNSSQTEQVTIVK